MTESTDRILIEIRDELKDHRGQFVQIHDELREHRGQFTELRDELVEIRGELREHATILRAHGQSGTEMAALLLEVAESNRQILASVERGNAYRGDRVGGLERRVERLEDHTGIER